MRSMRAVAVIVAVVLLCVCSGREGGGGSGSGNRYGFYRTVGASGRRKAGDSGRRVFGGRAAPAHAWPAACVLLDRYMAARCSGSVVAGKWVLTAAHCVTPHLAYVKYNTQQVASGGQVAPVLVLYRHPGYRVVQEDLGRGTDVTLLHHDVGLVRTRNTMHLKSHPALNPIHAMTMYSMRDITGDEVQVLGFGRTEAAAQGEELVEVRLRVVSCERGTWLACVCGRAVAGERSAGVCSGDSGGPVLYRGVQLAVTSMGPVECRQGRSGLPDDTATSVFTALYDYASLINATILDTEDAMRMSRIANDAHAHATRLTLHTAAAALTAHTIIK